MKGKILGYAVGVSELYILQSYSYDDASLDNILWNHSLHTSSLVLDTLVWVSGLGVSLGPNTL